VNKTIHALAILALFLLLTPRPAPAAGLTSEVKMHNGVPCLYVNGRLTSQMLSAPYRPGEQNFTDFQRTGNKIYDIYFHFGWTGPTNYDFTRLDELLASYVKIDPNALFVGRILLTPGAWLAEQFPTEVSRRDDGSLAGMFGTNGNPSFSSLVYRDLSHKAMTALITHLEQKFGDNIAGYQVGNGFGGEWLPFNSFWETRGNQPHPTKFGVEDYSPAAKIAFQKWLRAKYKTVAALRQAWGEATVTFETAAPPDEKTRYSPQHGIFFDPAISTRVPDYFEFYNNSVADVLIENSAWAKELTHRKKIVGAFYGYLWCNFPNLSAVHAGHLGLTKVLRCPDVDFLASPYTYDNKYVGGPDNSQSLPEAAQLHGKLYFNEVDTETYVTQRQWRWGNSLNNPTNWAETKGLLVRDFGYSFTKGFGLWWTDLFGGTFHDDKISSLIGDLRKIDEQSLEANKTSTAEVAVILDESGFMYCGDGEPLFNALLTAQKQWELGFLGAPWEPHLLSDISNPKLKNFKLYVFLNTFHVTPEQREAIHRKLRRNGATAVWVYAPGYITDKLSTDNMRALTGIDLAETNIAGELHVDITSFVDPFTTSLSNNFAYGTDVNVSNIIKYYDHQIYLKDPRDPALLRDLPGFSISPRFYGNDPKATVLGKLAGVDQPGLLVKKQDGWISVYSSAPILPAPLLRNIARAAGCHIYSDANDVVYANKNFLCLYAPGGGSRQVKLLAKSKVTDLLENKLLADGVSEFPLELAPNTAVLLKLEPVK
jgi:Beta-galactosidase